MSVQTIDRQERSETRLNAAGLTVTRTFVTETSDDGTVRCATYDRTEPFAAEALARGINTFKGQRVYLWRCETIESDWRNDAGRVTYYGFNAYGQTVGATSDEDAARRFRTHRTGDRRIMRAIECPDYARAGDRHERMMSY